MKAFKWNSYALFILAAIAFLSACKREIIAPASDTNNAKGKLKKHLTPIQLFTDPDFQRGFKVLHPTTGAVQGSLQYTSAYGTPVWDLGQWYSQSSIYGATQSTLASGSYQYANSDKAITIGPTTSTDGSIIFAINGQNEFGGVYRGASDDFPALLAGLKIADPDGWLGATTPFISSMDSLIFNIDAKLLYHSRNQTVGYDSVIHAAQFSCTFLVQNLNPASAGYGKAMYFMILMYDDRYPYPGQTISIDMFTNQLIYNIGMVPFSSTGMSVGNWKNVNGDLLPYVKAGLQEAWDRNILTESESFDDYKVSLFIVGLECPGLNTLTVQAKNLSLIAK